MKRAVLAVAASVLVMAPVANAASRVGVTSLPGGVSARPEGVAADGTTIFVSSVASGTIFRFEAGAAEADVFLPGGVNGRSSATGMKVAGDRLYLSGAGTGRIFVYDTDTGAELFNGSTGVTPSFVNDVAVAPDGTAYFTDSLSPVIYALSPDLQLSVFRDLTGTVFQYQPGFNANGIVVTPNGKWALVVQSNTGKLFRVTLADGTVEQVDLGTATVTGGDGLVLRGSTLWVVRGGINGITKVKVGNHFLTGVVQGDVSDPTFAFPTTAAISDGRMVVVNAQFNRPTDPVLPFTVTSIKVP